MPEHVSNDNKQSTKKGMDDDYNNSKFFSLLTSRIGVIHVCIAVLPVWVALFLRRHNTVGSRDSTSRTSSIPAPDTNANTNNHHHHLLLSKDDDTSFSYLDASTGMDTRARDSKSTCQFFLAESSIPNAGLGIYTAVDLQSHDRVAPTDLVLRIFDFELHNDYDKNANKNFFLTKDYAWNTMKINGAHSGKAEANRESTIVPGPGMLTNCHMGLRNVAIGKLPLPPQQQQTNDGTSNSGLLHRSTNPGVGAFSSHFNISHYATRTIRAGSELFNDYGTRWFQQREEKLGLVPFAEHYREADKITRSTNDFFVQHSLSFEGNLGVHLWRLIWKGNAADEEVERVVLEHGDSVGNSSFLLVLAEKVVSLVQENKFDHLRTQVALPKTAAEVDHAARLGSARLSVPNFIRSPEWLDTNGMCLDNIRAGSSTIKEAGRGAFAQRFLRGGERIAPAPLIHIPNRHVLDMYVVEGGGAYGQPKKVSETKIDKQLLLNYCYGHKNSTMLLFPYSSVVNYINHMRETPNAMIRWSSSPYHHQDWMNFTVDDMKMESRAGLMMEYVATRDILPGEEIFIDYGEDWDRSWRKHVKRWKPVLGQDSYIPASEMNYKMAPITTAFEESSLSYPPNIEVACYYEYSHSESSSDEETLMLRGLLSSDPSSPAELDKLNIRAAYQWENQKDLFIEINRHPCKVITKELSDEGIDLYLAIITQRDTGQTMHQLVKEIPRKAIVFQDRQYTSDQQLPNVFRHDIAIPDSMFPPSWKNI